MIYGDRHNKLQRVDEGSKQTEEVTEGSKLLPTPRRTKCPNCKKYTSNRVFEGSDGVYFRCNNCGELFYVQTKETKTYRKYKAFFPEAYNIPWEKVKRFLSFYERLVPGLVKYDDRLKCVLYRRNLDVNSKWGFVEVRVDNKVIVRLLEEELGDIKP